MNELLRTLLFLPPQASTVAAEVDLLHFFVISITMLGAAGVTVVGGYFLIKYRARAPSAETAEHAPRRHVRPMPLSLEFGAIGGLLTLFLLWWYIGFSQYMRLRVAPEHTLDVYVTGKMWMWNFAYGDGSGSAGTLYVPARVPVKLLLTSRDVIHSFYVPDFRVKQDAVPGRFTTAWFEAKAPGTYEILCAEYCGMSHSAMRGLVVVMDPADWKGGAPGGARSEELLAQTLAHAPGTSAAGAGLVELGERTAVAYGCVRCHTVDGTPHIGPTWAGLDGALIPLEDGSTVRADEAYLTASMMEPRAQIHRGYRPVMPSYFGALPAPEAAAIVEYIKSLRALRRGPDVQVFGPTDVPVPAPEPQPLLLPQTGPARGAAEGPIPPPGTE
jgi:cytochrome c oxidase subunit 2